MVFKIGVVIGALAGYLVGSGKASELVAHVRGWGGRGAAGNLGREAEESGVTAVVVGSGRPTLLIPDAAP